MNWQSQHFLSNQSAHSTKKVISQQGYTIFVMARRIINACNRALITNVSLVFKMGIHGVEANSSVRLRGTTATPYSFQYAMIIGTIPFEASYVPIDRSQVRTNQFHVRSILAPLPNGKAIECNQAFSPIYYRPYTVGTTHHASLDSNPDVSISDGIYVCLTWRDAANWAQSACNIKNDVSHLGSTFACTDLPIPWQV